MSKHINYERNSIVYVKNPITKDMDTHAMRGNHFAIVIQNDASNRTSDAVTICYLTSKIKHLHIKTNVPLGLYEGLYNNPAMAMCEQIATVDRNDILKVVDKLRPDDIEKFNRGLLAAVGLDDEGLSL